MKRSKKQAQTHSKKPRLDEASESEEVVEKDVAPTRRPVAATSGDAGLDETLTDDALVAVCRHVHSAADLVRLSCASRTLHRLIAHPTGGVPVWRELFRRERGASAYEAMSELVQLHGADAVRHVFVATRHDRLQAMAAAKVAPSTPPQDSSVWCEAFIETDEQLAWRRLLADVASDSARGLAVMVEETALMAFRDTIEARLAAWIGDDEADDNDNDKVDKNGKSKQEQEMKEDEDEDEGGEEKGENEEDGGDADNDDNDDNEEEDDDEDQLAKSEPKLETKLQKRQVRMLLNMMHVIKHTDHSCGDDYRGRFSASTKNVALAFLRDNIVSSVESSGSDGQYEVTTCKISVSVGGEARNRVMLNLRARHDQRHDTPQPQLRELWHALLKPSDDEGLTFRQFLHFLGVALDLTHEDDYERGHTAFHSFLDLAPK